VLGDSHKKAVYRFGPFQLDPEKATLARNGNQLKLQDLPYRLLVLLVERPGEIVSREEVRQHLWPQNTFVEFDNSLGVAIRKIRDALGDNADAPCYVETVPRRGYRFLAAVTTVTESHDPTRYRPDLHSGGRCSHPTRQQRFQTCLSVCTRKGLDDALATLW